MPINTAILREAVRNFYAEHGHYPSEKDKDLSAEKYGVNLTWAQIDWVLEREVQLKERDS